MTADDLQSPKRSSSPPTRSRLWPWIVFAVVLLAVLVLRTVQLRREEITLRVAPHQGDALSYRVTMSRGTEPAASPPPADARGVATVTVTLTVTAANEMGATLEAAVTSGGVEVDERAMGHGDLFLPLHLPAESHARITLDPTGKAQVTADAGPAREALQRFLADLFTPLPDRPVGLEDRWHAESAIKTNGLDVQVEIARWLTAVEAERALVRIDGGVKMEPIRNTEDDDDGDTVRMSIRGSEVISRADGLLVERSLVMKTTIEKQDSFGDTKLQLKPYLTLFWERGAAK
jgi:hypothetical protein